MSKVDPLAFDVQSVSKAFALPHHRTTTFKEVFLHPWQHTTYERQLALQNVSFQVNQGEFFGIIGPNGSGKSTMLKILAGIYRQDEGEVRVNGRVSPFIELGAGFNPELNARDNVRINATLLGLSKTELERRFDEIIAFAELGHFIDQKLKNFSSGMLLRLAYSIAIQVPFEILLLDEVLAVGDDSFQQKCFATFRRFRAEGKTMIFVSHDLGAVTTYCDRALLLEGGVPRDTGPATDVVKTYQERTGPHPLLTQV